MLLDIIKTGSPSGLGNLTRYYPVLFGKGIKDDYSMTGPLGRIQGGGGSSERQIMTNLLNEMDPSNVMLSSNISINT